MPRRIFFSFHYQRDIWRVNQVRQSWRYTQGNDTQPFYDRSLWESEKRKGEAALRKVIDDGLSGTTATVVLAGSETFGRKWVDYEIDKSYRDGKGLVVVYVDHLKNQAGLTGVRGKNPLSNWTIKRNGSPVALSNLFKEYVWEPSTGAADLECWVEESIRIRKGL